MDSSCSPVTKTVQIIKKIWRSTDHHSSILILCLYLIVVPLSKPSIWYKSPKPWVRAAKSNSCKQITSSADGGVGVSGVSVPVKYSSHWNCWEVKSRPVSAETAHSSNFRKRTADLKGWSNWIYADMIHKFFARASKGFAHKETQWPRRSLENEWLLNGRSYVYRYTSYKHYWSVLNPQPAAHLLAIEYSKWPSFIHLLVTN